MRNSGTGVGKAINRVDGMYKVTGKAKYSAEFPIENIVFAHGINSTVAKGTIISIDTSEAEKQPGVLSIITYKNAPKLKSPDKQMPQPKTDGLSPVLQSPEVHFYGEFIAVVVAETYEQARYAARLVDVKYQEATPKISFDENEKSAYAPDSINGGAKTDTAWGDVENALTDSEVTIEATYNTPIEHHHPMELHSLVASWQGEHLTVYLSTQMVDDAVTTIAETFDIPKNNIHVIASYIGGGFGSKLQTREHGSLAIMAAKKVNRPVQLVLTRQQMFTNIGYRQHNRQKMRLGADKDGNLKALVHETIAQTSTTEEFQEQCGAISRTLYNTPNSLVTHRLMTLNLPSPRWTRAPGEAPGSFALESAMDELAYKLDMDPVEFRIKNDTQKDLSTDKPYSSRQFIECLKIGAEKFGWNERKQKPRSNKNGNWWVGYGMSGSSRKAPYQETSARIILTLNNDNLKAVVELDATDIGTGSYTIIGQTAAEYMDIPIENVTVKIGDSNFPVTPGSGGSWGAASYANGTRSACVEAKKQLLSKAPAFDESAPVQEIMKASGLKEFTAQATAKPSEEFDNYSVYSFGANYAEVWVNEEIGSIRLKRFVNVASAGKIINPKTAYSQIIGGITWGVGMALTEHSTVEPNYGNFITRTLADYHVPVNLDLANIEVVFLPENDQIANPMGVKGIGELGITSIAAAITNAVFNATGRRFRDIPITPEKLIRSTSIEMQG